MLIDFSPWKLAFNTFLMQLDAHTGNVVLQLLRSRSRPLTPVVVWPSAPAHPCGAINGFASNDNIQSSFSIYRANAFRSAQSHDRDIHAGSTRSASPHMGSATDYVAR